MSQWHVAPALETFIHQLNAAFPHRDTRSDGTIGDLRHQNEAGGSDHNPDSTGTVCAFDGTHGPYWHVTVQDVQQIVNELVASGDPRINYIIFNRRIWTKAKGWHAYTGTSPHLEHFHLSVNHGALANDAALWGLPSFGGMTATIAVTLPSVSVTDLVAASTPDIPQEQDDDDMAQWIHNTADGTIVRATTLEYVHLTPGAWALDEKFGAKASDVDPATFSTYLSSRREIQPGPLVK